MQVRGLASSQDWLIPRVRFITSLLHANTHWHIISHFRISHTASGPDVFNTDHRQRLNGKWKYRRKKNRKRVTAWPVKMVPIGCPETSVTKYQYTLRNVPEERRSHLYRGASLKALKQSEKLCKWFAFQCLVPKSHEIVFTRAPGGAVGRGTALQSGRLRVRFPMVSLEYFIDNPSGRTMALELTQTIAEMSTGNISWFFIGKRNVSDDSCRENTHVLYYCFTVHFSIQ